MITLSAVMGELRARLGLGPEDYVPGELVSAAITNHLRGQREAEPPTSDDEPGGDGAAG
jgi:hypothetical protein